MKKIILVFIMVALLFAGVLCAAAETVSLSGATHVYTDPSWRNGRTLYTIAPGKSYTVTLGGNSGDRVAMWVLRPFAAEATHWAITFADLKNRINTYLYDDETGAYYTYFVKEKRLQTERLYNSTFDVFKRKIVPEDRVPKLLEILKSDDTFNWNSKYGITTMSHTSAEFTETRGLYQGAISWEGNIWTLRSEIIATGLYEYGLREDCAHLLWQTVTSFAGNYAEFLTPSDGMGQGVLRYGWSASQFIELIVEYIFGISYDAWTDTITIDPCVPPELYGETLTIKGVSLGNGKKLNVEIFAHDAGNIDVRYEIN